MRVSDKEPTERTFLPWALRFLDRKTYGRWEDVPYDQLEREELWKEFGMTLHFVTLEFEDVEMERGFQGDLARRKLGNGSMNLINTLKWSYDFMVMFLCASLVAWVKFTLWHPSENCITRLGDKDVSFDRYLPTEPLVTLVICGALCWIHSAYLVTRCYKWYINNFCMVHFAYATVTMIAYFTHEYVAIAYYTQSILWTKEEGLSFSTFMLFIGAFYSLRFVHIIYLMGASGVTSLLLRRIAVHSEVFRRQSVLGNDLSEKVLVIVALVVLCIVVYFFEKIMRKDFILSLSLAAESELSDRLLTNILPAEVVQRLKNSQDDALIEAEERPHSPEQSEGEFSFDADNQMLARAVKIAEAFDSVSILFVEITGLNSRISESVDDRPLRILARFLALFDSVADVYGLEKIKSIGTTYMAVSGLPARKTTHARDAVLAALEMMKVATAHAHSLGLMTDGKNWPVGFRAGIHSGPVIAGVIGRKKFSYDVWGDTVNVASRMHHAAELATLLITADTAQQLSEEVNLPSVGGSVSINCLDQSITLESNGERDIKGKGKMTTYAARLNGNVLKPFPATPPTTTSF